MRRRTFTAINLTGLALGMPASIFAFLWAQNEFSFDRYHRQADYIYRLNTDLKVSANDTWHWATTPFPLLDEIKNNIPEVVNSATLNGNMWPSVALKKDANLLRSEKFGYVSEDWFHLFNYQFISGAPAGFQENLRSVILTRNLADRLFGRWDVAGESFQLDTLEFVVHAVVENLPANSSFNQDMWLPQSFYLSNNHGRENENWSDFNYLTFVELRPGSNAAEIGEKITSLLKKHKEDEEMSIRVQPLSAVHFDEETSSMAMLTGNRSAAWAVGCIGLIILFLACVNYVSLTTAQAGMRTREVGVRKIVGAGGQQIFSLLFTESLLTVGASLLFGLGMVQLALPYFNSFTGKVFRLDPTNASVWLVGGGTLVLSLLMSGVYPALFLTGFSPSNFLRGQSFLKMKNANFRKALVVAQFTITVGLIIGAVVILQQQDFIRKKDLGYDRSHVFEFNIPCCDGREASVNLFKQALSNEPGVVGTAASNMSIINMNSTHSGSIDWDGKPEDFVPTVYQASADADVAELLQLPLMEGRWFQPNNEADKNNVVLNESAVEFFQMPKPIVGQKFHFQGREGQVIGIIKDFHFQTLRKKIGPMVICNNPFSNGNFMVKTTSGQAAKAIAAAGEVWVKNYPGLPFEYRFLDDSFDQLYKSEAKNAALFKLLAGLAVFISCLGLFGLAVFSTQQRTREIGVRKVLGASVPGLVGLLSKDFLSLVILSLVIASPLAYIFMEKWLQDFAYRIDIHWSVFVLAGVVAVGVAFLTVSFQSIKAALANPVKSLRSE